MSGDLKSKLSAKAEAERKARVQEAERSRRYRETVLREYPKLVNELVERVGTLIDGVQDVQLTKQVIKEELSVTTGSSGSRHTVETFGSVEVPHFAISIVGRPMISFKPAGVEGGVGFHAAIEVQSSNPIDLPQSQILMTAKGGDNEHWVLAVRKRNPGPREWNTELTDEMLSALLEQALC